ncbi:MAG: putative metal-dependent hydrolase, TIM-barrel fold [Chloroflexi bacterium]|jgi:predicted TIM-barrel fold metal-dependent hydrolase|nr:MAG: putative metal-dependent hydrolase, TIM-barrel fold [Chloroflexota bacterium]
MTVIDADAHVIENARTWEFMDEADLQYKPRRLTEIEAEDALQESSPVLLGAKKDFWLIDGKLRPYRAFDSAKSRTPSAASEALDVPARLQHMDELGTDIQVLYPTIFLLLMTDKPAVEKALCKSYNRWLADIWRQSDNRLRWVVVPPIRDIDAAIAEIRFGKENGACGVFMLGINYEKLPNDSYYFPIYEEASSLDMPICIHSGSASLSFDTRFSSLETLIWLAKFPVTAAMHTLYMSKVPQKFPKIRWGFIEASGSFVPYVLHDLGARHERMYNQKVVMNEVLRDNRFFVTAQTDDDLDYVVKYAGESQLVLGTDYGHVDTASELEALQLLRSNGAVSQQVASKILDDNPRELYGI